MQLQAHSWSALRPCDLTINQPDSVCQPFLVSPPTDADTLHFLSENRMEVFIYIFERSKKKV